MYRIITDYIEEAVVKYPNKIAFADEKKTLSFAELRERSLSVAAAIRELKLWKNSVAVYMDKGPDCVAGFMGVAYSGNYYTPMDTALPNDRTKVIFDQLHPKAIVTTSKYVDKLKEIDATLELIVYDELPEISEDVEKQILKDTHKIVDTDILYVMFTSGSTGVPKGVIISHAAVISYTEWYVNAFSFTEETIVGNQTPLYFSMSVSDVYGTLRCKCSLYFIPKMYFAFPANLITYLNDKKISSIYWVPSALCIVADSGILKKRKPEYLKQVLFAGESMPRKQFDEIRKELPDLLYANLFGPTETVDICAYYIIDEDLKDGEDIPVGYACENTGLLILPAEEAEEREDGIKVGELCVRGSTLSYGYYGDAEKTKNTFVKNPLEENYTELIYKTGDLVHYDEIGRLIYDGRKDFQIKHMGRRIELGELENSLNDTDAKRTVAIYDNEKKCILLFYSGEISEEDAKKHIKEKLPVYMCPEKCIKVKNFPLNANGKIDRKVLMRDYLED